MINLNEESLAIHYVRLAAEKMTDKKSHFICNDLKMPKKITYERQIFLMLELISREPRPFVEHIEGCRLRRAEIIGEGTKKSPYRAQWRNDYYLD